MTDDVKPTNEDVDAALRLSRKYIYDGNEPHAPAVMSFARMLAAHRVELESRKGVFGLGDVVQMDDLAANAFGVIVALPTSGYPRYRVRITTDDWNDFVEVGARAEEMRPDPRRR